MSFKGFNSILFDFDSIIDIELSIIRYMDADYFEKYDLPWLNKKLFGSWKTVPELAFRRMYGIEDLFRMMINSSSGLNYYKTMIDIWNRDKQSIIDRKLTVTTDILDLLKAYRLAGDGVIKTTVRVSDSVEESHIKKLSPSTSTIISNRKDVDTSIYTRIIIGNYRSIFEYVLKEPKSIVILNYRDNFTDDNIELLRPELIVNFGDIHDISVISAYKEIKNDAK